jgi:serine/threonine-protein kinase
MARAADDATLDDPRPDAERAPPPARVKGRYEIDRVLGAGGMGEVYEARDAELDRVVALKTMRSDRRAPHLEARFLREACVQAQLEHPSIVPVFEVDRDASAGPFFTMRKVSGIPLGEVLADKKHASAFDRHRLLSAFAEVCLAVHAAHTRGVLHRDLKPSNIMLGDFGEVYVLDWGLAKLTPLDDAPSSSRDPERTDSDDVPVVETVAGSALGTPAYMAPEQLTGNDALDARADVFSLGAVLFEILTGESLFRDAAVKARLEGTLLAWDARPSARTTERAIAPELDRICVRATARRAPLRYPSARALHDAVAAFLDGERDLDLRAEHAERLVEQAALARRTHPDAAFRDVHRALALAPEHPRALALLFELLEPAPETVALARAEVDAEGPERSFLSQFGAVLFTMPWLTLYPAACVLEGVTDVGLALVPPLAWVVAALTLVIYQRRGMIDRNVAPSAAISTAVACCSILFGPLIIVPALAITLIAQQVLMGSRRHRVSKISMACASIAVPAVLAIAGVHPVYRFDGTTAMIVSSLFRRATTPELAVALLVADLLMVGSSAVFAGSFRAVIERARTTKVLSAWQLAQLLPPSIMEHAAAATPPPPRKTLDTDGDAYETGTDTEELHTRATGERRRSDSAVDAFWPDPKRYTDGSVIPAGPHAGMYRVHDRRLVRDVVLERPHGETADEFQIDAVRRASLEHPGVPPIYDLGHDAEGPWLTTKLVRGAPLRTVTSVRQRLAAFAKACLVIDYAHQQGIVHGAIDAESVVGGELGEVHVLGWSRDKSVGKPDGRRSIDVAALGDLLAGLSSGSAVIERIASDATNRRFASAREIHDAVQQHLASDRDEELRRALAEERLARAETSVAHALETGGEAERIEALRALGQALALATDRTSALALLRRLLTTPLPKLPVAVRQEMDAQTWELARRGARGGAMALVLVWLVAFPLCVILTGMRSPGATLATMAGWGVAAFSLHRHSVAGRVPLLPWPSLGALVALLATTVFFGPYFVVPGLTVTFMTAYALAARPVWHRMITIIACVTVVLSHALMWSGLFDAGSLTMIDDLPRFGLAGAATSSPRGTLVVLFLFTLGTLLFSALNAARFRDLLDDLEAENRAKVRALSRLI